MKRIALFAGSFDPFTRGHEDIVLRGLKVFDEIVIAIGYNSQKNSRYFPIEMMVERITQTFAGNPDIKVLTYSELTAELARKLGAKYLLRGLRNTTDFEYIYMRNRSDRGLELINDDSWWWLKRNSERVFNDAKTAQSRNTEMTVMWNRWRATLFSWYPNVIAIGPDGSWPFWSLRTIIFYGLSVVLWLGYFYAFLRLRRSTAPGA